MRQKAWFVLALCCVPAASTSAQNTPAQRRATDYSIQGKIVFPENRDPDLRVEVRLESGATQVIFTAFTDSGGNFEFRNLAPGPYYISVNAEGYEPFRQSVASFGGNSLTIVLSKPVAIIKERPTGLDADDRDIVDISQMKENLPKKAVQDYEKAILEKQKGKIESAMKLLEDAIRIAPNFFHAHNNLGLIYLLQKRYPDAETEFKRSHELSPKSERPLVNIGSLYIEQAILKKDDREVSGKLLDQALDALELSVKLNPHSAPAYFLLGQANYRSSFFDEAEAAFKKAQEADPNLVGARLMLANIYVKQEKWAEALDALDSYLKDSPRATDRTTVEELRERVAKNLERSDK
jgi:cytochrome c-type biogenesis protein CcmH/NrfG